MNRVQHDSETSARGQQIITACAFIHHDFGGVEKVILPKRTASRKFLPGVYELPGGHIDFGEDILDGLRREIREELGMDIKVGDPFFVFTYTNNVKGSHSIEVIYFAEFIGSHDKIVLNPDDHSCYDWFAEDELEKAYSTDKGVDDIEMKAIKKGFAVLNGQSLDF